MNTTASPMPLTIDGTEYQISPLSDQASHGVTQWLRADVMASAWMAEQEVNRRGGNGAELAKAIIQAVLQVEWTDQNGAAVLRGDRGLARLLLESLKPTVAGITEKKAASLLKSEEGVKTKFWDTFLMVNDLQEVDDGDAPKKKSDAVHGDAGATVPAPMADGKEASGRVGDANPNPTGAGNC